MNAVIPARPEVPRSVSLSLGALLAIVGGFLDSYTYITRNGVFATSQTGNIVLFGIESARGQWSSALRHLPPLLAFLAGVLAAELLKRPRLVRLVRWPARAALVIEIIALLIVGALPASTPDAVVTLTVAFTCSVQVSMFRTLIKWQYNTTMTTGNLRSAAQALFLAWADRDTEAALRARAFGTILLAFAAGAVLGGACSIQLGVHAAWVAAACLMLALWLFIADHLGPRVAPE